MISAPKIGTHFGKTIIDGLVIKKICGQVSQLEVARHINTSLLEHLQSSKIIAGADMSNNVSNSAKFL